MGKERKSKRQLIRDEKKAKKRARVLESAEASREKKRQRVEGEETYDPDHDHDESASAAQTGVDYDDGRFGGEQRGQSAPEREFFGMLTDEEQEYFRSADQKLETNDFGSAEDRGYFLQSLYRETAGKELKLASSQSCSRLMERLILLSNTRQKKALFEAFAGHFITLVTHRFASHCCEKLFLQSSPAVSHELGGMKDDNEPGASEDDGQQAPKASMEELFLLTLDELEPHLSYLLSEKFGSHSLRVLMVVLSGRPLEQVSTKSLLQSKRKEHISVQGALNDAAKINSEIRDVPESFTLAVQKIIEDTTATMDSTALRVLATHPMGNPVLQLLVELDMSLNGKDKAKKDRLLLLKLLPGAPESLCDSSTAASDFVNSMMYDAVGSRLLETIITYAPAKIFKALNSHFFSPRIHTYVRNDIACYPAIKALNRMSGNDLAAAVKKIVPEISKVLAAKRLSALRVLFERCHVRQATEQLESLLRAVCEAFGTSDGSKMVPILCGLEDQEDTKENIKERNFQPPLQSEKQKAAAISHGCQLATALLNIPGAPAQAIQQSLITLSTDRLLHLATSTTSSMTLLTTAFSCPAQMPNFHKALVMKLSPKMVVLARSPIGHNIVNAIITIPSKAGSDAQTGVVPFHLKETIMNTLGRNEQDLREIWTGRSVWRTWKGDQWKFRRGDWVRFAKEVDPKVKSEEKLRIRVAEKKVIKTKNQNQAKKDDKKTKAMRSKPDEEQ